MMKHKLTTWCMLFIAHLITGRSCFHVSLKAPRYADLGGQVVLECEYNVHADQLHKVEWLKGGRKLFQYVKGRTPPFRNYTTPGAVLDWNNSNERQVMLRDLDFEASGQYACEVSTETPIYTKPSDDLELTVMQGQLEDPYISFGKTAYMVGELLQVNCTSGPARPTPDVTWLVNGHQAHKAAMKLFPEESPNSVTVQLTLTIEEQHLVDGLKLTCVSTIPAYLGHHARHSHYADHREHARVVHVMAAIPETTTPRYVNGNGRCSGENRLSLSHLLFTAVLLSVLAQ